MEAYQTEDQELAIILKFLKENGRFILTLILIICCSFFGIHKFKQYQENYRARASDLYQEMLSAIKNDDFTVAKDKGQTLINKYRRTPYSLFSAMLLAKMAIDEQDIDTALTKLRWIVDHHKKAPLWHVAKIKIARLLHATGNSEAALKELNNTPNGYEVLYEEVKGDIYFSMNELDKAREAYKKAITSVPMDNMVPWLQLKLQDLGEEVGR